MEAGLAKSILDEHNIFCSLADENANLYGGAPLAMPVRLLVNEGQADEALRILKNGRSRDEGCGAFKPVRRANLCERLNGGHSR